MQKKNLNTRKVIGYVLGLVVFSFLVYIGGAKTLKASFKPHLGYLFLTFLSMLTVFLISSIRWGYIINSVKGRKVCSYFDYFLYFMAGRFSGQYISAAAGDFLLRPAALKRIQGVNLKLGISSSILDKLLDVLFICILIVPSLLYVFGVLSEFAAVVIVAILVTGLLAFFFLKGAIFLPVLRKCLLVLLTKLRAVGLFGKLIKDKHIEAVEDLKNLEVFRKNILILPVIITIIRYGFLILRIYFLSAALGLKIPLFVLVAGIPIAQLSLALAITPGALGVLELGWEGILSFCVVAEISQGDISTFLFGQRFYWLIFTSIIFMAMYLLAGIKNLYKNSRD